MVLKISKYGVRSGNTLKASNSRFLRRYRLHSCIRRQLIKNDGDVDESFSDILGVGSAVRDDYTEFSLNKKGRWSLPGQLREDILRGGFKHEQFGVQLIEGHKLLRKSSCISFASSFGRIRDVRISRKKRNNNHKRRGYFQVTSILNAKPANTSNRSHRAIRRNLRNAYNNETTQPPKEEYTRPEIRYEVLYPSPITSSITHNPKYIDPGYGDVGTSSRRTRQRKARSKLVKVIEEDLGILGDDFDDSEEENQSPGSETPERETKVTLEEILHLANKAKSLVTHANKRSPKDFKSVCKDRIVYCNEDELKRQSQDSVLESRSKSTNPNSNILTTCTFEPVAIILSTEEVDEWALKNRFGSKLLECECFPRKFVIDISEEVSNLDNMKYVENSKAKADTTFAYLVFTHDVLNEINNEYESVYNVHLSLPLNETVQSIKIETMFDYLPTSLDEIIQKSIFFVDTLPNEVFVKEERPYSQLKRSSGTALEDCAKWGSESYRLDNKYLIDTCFRGNEHRVAAELGYDIVSAMDAFTAEPNNVASPEGKFCSVCFESIGGKLPATALMSCCHWFCNTCWMEHLSTGIRESRTELVCPEYDCDRHVDLGTLMTLVGAGHVIQFLRRCHDTQVEQQSVTKWCPNPACGAVVKVPSNKVKTVTCQCGRKICFDCLGEMHWPAPCKAAFDYKKKLVENGDDKLIPFDEIQTVEIKGKACPNCNRFVEKNGGCPYMFCACRKSFCWGCGKEWNSTTHGADCYKHGYSNTYHTTTETIKPDDYLIDKLRGRKSGKKWYKVALEHRVQQHQVKLQKLRKPMKELTSKLQHFVGRAEWRKEPVSFEFGEHGKQYTCEAAKTKDFLKNMLDLYVELHQIAEHVAVYQETLRPGGNDVIPVRHITSRMTALSVFIYDLLQNGSALDAKHVFMKLKEIRFHARQCITGLVKCINRVQT